MKLLSSTARAFGLAALAFAVSSPAGAAEQKEISGLTGPKAPVGMAIVELGAIKLGPEFPQIPEAENYLMRGRYVTVKAGGIVPIHSHKDRPAVTYVIQGEIVEHRSDQDGPILRKAGDVTLDNKGLAQWWENKSGETVTLFVVDFLDPTATAGH